MNKFYYVLLWDNKRTPGSQSFEAYVPSWAKGKGIGICGFKGKEENSEEDG